MRLWIDQVPDDHKDIEWSNGTLCLELRIAPRAASDHAMLELKFTQDDLGVFKVLFMQSGEDRTVISDIAIEKDIVHNGIVKIYHGALVRMFDRPDTQDIFPSGTLEILGGRYGSIGSSDIAIITVAKILLSLFRSGKKFEGPDVRSMILDGCKVGIDPPSCMRGPQISWPPGSAGGPLWGSVSGREI